MSDETENISSGEQAAPAATVEKADPPPPEMNAPAATMEAPEVSATDAPTAPEVKPVPLRTDGPTLKEYIAAGYKAENYPPEGYAVKEEPPAEVTRHNSKRSGT